MPFPHTRFVWLPVALFVFLSADRAVADVYNLRLLSNHAPDLTDVESFCHSATSRWKTNDEKAAASRAYFARTLDEEWVKRHWQQWNTQGCHSIYRYRLSLRPGESYARYWEPLGTTADYYYPNGRGNDPNSYLKDRGRSNGRWIFNPDLTSDSVFESVRNVARSPRLPVHPARAAQQAEVVFKVQSANITTACIVKADLYRRTGEDTLAIEASCNAGHSWFPVWEAQETGELPVSQWASGRLLTGDRAGHSESSDADEDDDVYACGLCHGSVRYRCPPEYCGDPFGLLLLHSFVPRE